MAVDDVRFQARRDLESVGLSMETAAYLADDRPPGGWDSLVTKDYLHAELAEVRTEIAQVRTEATQLRVEFERALRSQTRWLLGAVFLAFGLFAGLVRYG